MQTSHQSENLRIVVAAGGTGGHIFPALAVVEQLKALTNNRIDVKFLGSEDRMESTMLPEMGFDYTPMPIGGFKGVLSLSSYLLPIKIMRSIKIARDLVRSFKPHVVLTTGAYISYPAGVAGVKEGIPLVVMESNVNPGKTNKRLSAKAAAVLVAFEESRDYLPERVRDKVKVTGNPVRRQITDYRKASASREGLGLKADLDTVLVFGGSLGALSINSALQALCDVWDARGHAPSYQIYWQTGKNFTARVPDSLKESVKTTTFIEDMGVAYSAANVVVSRSGATTVAELGSLGKPAILIPLPSASTDEQRRNAEAAGRTGGAVVIEDSDAARSLADTLDALMIDPRRLEKMASGMAALGMPNAAEDAARIVLDVSKWTGNLEDL